jgi:hypothetical protein
MSRNAFAGALLVASALTLPLAAQGPAQQTPPTPNNPAPAQSAQPAKPVTVTVEGCLLPEKDVPGRKPNVAEQAGVMEDYILTQAKIVKTSAQPLDQAVGTSGTVAMYEIKEIDAELLKKHAGQRVQIDGALQVKDVKERQRTEAERPGSTDDLPEVKGIVIRMVAASCTK